MDFSIVAFIERKGGGDGKGNNSGGGGGGGVIEIIVGTHVCNFTNYLTGR